jgi:hypothetical protein
VTRPVLSWTPARAAPRREADREECERPKPVRCPHRPPRSRCRRRDRPATPCARELPDAHPPWRPRRGRPLLKVLRRGAEDSPSQRFGHHRGARRSAVNQTPRCRHGEKLLFGFAGRGRISVTTGACGDCPRLVEDQGIDVGGPFEEIGALDENVRPRRMLTDVPDQKRTSFHE